MEYQKAMKIAEKIRRKCGNCAACPISMEQNGVGVGCDTFLLKYPLQAEKVLEQWEKQHRKKTYKEDFFQRFPDAPVDRRGYPYVLPCAVYANIDCKELVCLSCDSLWDEEIS